MSKVWIFSCTLLVLVLCSLAQPQTDPSCVDDYSISVDGTTYFSITGETEVIACGTNLCELFSNSTNSTSCPTGSAITEINRNQVTCEELPAPTFPPSTIYTTVPMNSPGYYPVNGPGTAVVSPGNSNFAPYVEYTILPGNDLLARATYFRQDRGTPQQTSDTARRIFGIAFVFDSEAECLSSPPAADATAANPGFFGDHAMRPVTATQGGCIQVRDTTTARIWVKTMAFPQDGNLTPNDIGEQLSTGLDTRGVQNPTLAPGDGIQINEATLLIKGIESGTYQVKFITRLGNQAQGSPDNPTLTPEVVYTTGSSLGDTIALVFP